MAHPFNVHIQMQTSCSKQKCWKNREDLEPFFSFEQFALSLWAPAYHLAEWEANNLDQNFCKENHMISLGFSTILFQTAKFTLPFVDIWLLGSTYFSGDYSQCNQSFQLLTTELMVPVTSKQSARHTSSKPEDLVLKK